jgi:hypothetical protein
MPTGSWKAVGAGGAGGGTGFDGGSALAGPRSEPPSTATGSPVRSLHKLSEHLSLASGDDGDVDVLARRKTGGCEFQLKCRSSRTTPQLPDD